jgi:hypothetical protein
VNCFIFPGSSFFFFIHATCSDAVLKWPIKDVRRVLRRRRLLREIGLELILSGAAADLSGSALQATGMSDSRGSGLFLAFSTPEVRDSVYRCILKASRLLESTWIFLRG